MIAVDTNVLIYLWFPSEKTSLVEKLLYADSDWVARLFWRSEFRNVVAQFIKRGVSFDEGVRVINDAENLMKGKEIQVESKVIMQLVNDSGCTAYDCEFVYVAKIKPVPLITFDQQVLKKFPGIAISVEGYIQSL